MEIEASNSCATGTSREGAVSTLGVDVRNRAVVTKLYWNERRSLKEIASLAGVSPSLVHYYMKKFGIGRREWTGLKPKRSPQLISDMYWKQNKTIREIALSLGLAKSTVRRHLAKRGKLRPRKASKYRRRPFSNDVCERAYLLGLRSGDLNAIRKSKNVVTARISTTHQAMLELFERTFTPYSQCISYSRRAFLTGYDWQIKAYLDDTFDFLVRKPVAPPQGASEFYHFLAGLSDSDGTWSMWRRNQKTGFAFLITSESHELLAGVKCVLEGEGLHVSLRVSRKKGSKKVLKGLERSIEVRLGMDVWTLTIVRKSEVRRLARKLLLLSRHREKIARMCLILDERNDGWAVLVPKIERLRSSTKEETVEMIRRAKIEYKIPHREAHPGVVG